MNSTQPKKILVLQLARLGDVLQSLPAIQGLKQLHPDAEITLLTRSTFADAARLSPCVDRLVELPTKEILGPYFENPSQESKAVTLAELIQWLQNSALREEYDLLLNFTYSKASSLLAQLIRAKERRGLFRSRDQEMAVRDAWSQYFVAQVLAKNSNLLHLNDLFSRVAGVEACAHPVRLAPVTMPKGLPSPQHGACYVGVQIGSSVAQKTLSQETWKSVCDAISEKLPHYTLVFFGSKAEAERIRTVAPKNSIVLAGLLRFHENLRWVRACEKIISPDTAMVHLASLAGTTVVNLSVGGVRAAETGPYGEGHCVLEPGDAAPEELAAAVCAALQNKSVGKTVLHSVTRLSKCADGSMRSELRAVNHPKDEVRNFFEQSYYLLAEFRCAGRQEDIAVPSLGAQAETTDRLLHYFDAMCALKKIGRMGQQFAVDLILHSNNRSALRKLTHDLSELDRLMGELHTSCEFARPLIDWVRVIKDLMDCSQTPEIRFQELAAAQEAAYRELEQNVDILEQLLQTAVETARSKKLNGETNADQVLPNER